MNTENTLEERPEWTNSKTITRLLGPSRSVLYDLGAKGLIRWVSLKGRGNIRGKRLFNYDSVKVWIESHEGNPHLETRLKTAEAALLDIVELVGGESDDPDRDIARMQDIAASALNHPL